MADQYGEFAITQFNDLDGVRLRIDRADPVVRIDPRLLAGIPAPGSDWPASYDGKVLRIHGVNRTVIYRIRDTPEPRPGCLGHWDYIGECADTVSDVSHG